MGFARVSTVGTIATEVLLPTISVEVMSWISPWISVEPFSDLAWEPWSNSHIASLMGPVPSNIKIR